MTETRYDISCSRCGTLIDWSHKSQKDAEANAQESQSGVFDSEIGGWLCVRCHDLLLEKRINPRDDYCMTEEYAYDSTQTANGVFLTMQTANRPHTCSHRPYCQIRPGQVYFRQTVSPWTIIADDVDDEGRAIGAPNGEWSIAKFHRYGDEHNQDLRPDELTAQRMKRPTYVPEPRREN